MIINIHLLQNFNWIQLNRLKIHDDVSDFIGLENVQRVPLPQDLEEKSSILQVNFFFQFSSLLD